MNPNTPEQTPAPTDIRNPLAVMQQGERVICEIKRHPFGIFGAYISGGLLLIVAALMMFFLLPQFATDANRSQLVSGGVGAFVIMALFVGIFLLIATKVYWGNRWIITSDSVTQVTQKSLFNVQSSQLSMANLEDVTAAQDGLLAHMLGYGTLRVETAGERSKFVFTFCPNPNYYAQQILQAREEFEQNRGARGEGNFSAQL